MKSTHNAQTFQPYDPVETLGNTSPTAPKPQKGNNCGVLGAVIMVVIAVVVTIYGQEKSAPFWKIAFAKMGMSAAISTATPIAAGATGAAAGSIVSQGVGVATGIQEKFSWNAVALAAIGGGISGGLGAARVGGAGAFGGALRGVISNAATQGIGVATGMQKDFSWAGVAAAGVSGAVIGHFHLPSIMQDASIGNVAANAGVSAAAALASAATRSLIDGSDFGDNVMAALPDVIGQTIGSAIAGRIAGNGGVTYAGKSYGGSKQLALNGDVALCQTNAAAPRRNLWHWLLDVTGFGDGQFGNQHVSPDRLEFDAANLRAAFRNAGRSDDGETIVVTGRRISRDAGRIIREAPVSIFRGVNDSIQDNVTQPIMAGSRWITHTARDPVYGARSLGNGFQQLDAAIARAARTDLVDATQNFVGGRLSHYGAEFDRDGAPGLANALGYDAGYTAPILAGGPYSVEARVGLSAEEALLFSLRGRGPSQGTFVDFAMIDDIAPGFYRAHPGQLRFTQATSSPNFGGGGTIDDLIYDLNHGLSPDQVGGGPLQIVMQDGVPFSIDNRRLVAFNAAGVSDIPIEIVSLENQIVRDRFIDRFDPIGGEGRYTVIVPRAGRTAAEQLLYEQGLIRRAP
jgi:hypothetical protein